MAHPVTKDELKLALASHPTKGELKQALANHPTKDELKQALANHPTKDELKQALANHPTKDDLEQALANHPTTDALDRVVEDTKTEFDNVRAEFNNVRAEFNNVRAEISALDQKISALDQKQQQRSFNFLCERGWQAIHKVGAYDSDGIYRIPEHFPSTVSRYWRLQRPTHIHKLIDLLKFYQVQHYDAWDHDDGQDISDENDSDSSNSSPRTSIDIAVHRHPLRALQALAVHIGLDFSKIYQFMKRADEVARLHADLVAAKRQRAEDLETSRQKMPRKADATRPSPPPPISRFTLQELEEMAELSETEKKSKSPSDPSATLGWDHGGQIIRDLIKARWDEAEKKSASDNSGAGTNKSGSKRSVVSRDKPSSKRSVSSRERSEPSQHTELLTQNSLPTS